MNEIIADITDDFGLSLGDYILHIMSRSTALNNLPPCTIIFDSGSSQHYREVIDLECNHHYLPFSAKTNNELNTLFEKGLVTMLQPRRSDPAGHHEVRSTLDSMWVMLDDDRGLHIIQQTSTELDDVLHPIDQAQPAVAYVHNLRATGKATEGEWIDLGDKYGKGQLLLVTQSEQDHLLRRPSPAAYPISPLKGRPPVKFTPLRPRHIG